MSLLHCITHYLELYMLLLKRRWSCIFRSCNSGSAFFMTCNLGRHFQVLHYSRPAGADPGICEWGPVPPIPFLSPSSLPFPSSCPLEVGPLKPVRGSTERCKLKAPPVESGEEPRPKTNLEHYTCRPKADRKPLVAIILNILSTMSYSRTIKI